MPNRSRLLPVRPHSLLLAGLWLALLAMFPPAVLSQGGVQISVTEEFGGMYKPGRWFPVIVSIDNRGGADGTTPETFEARLTITSTTHSERHPTIDFVREVSVPPYSSQRFVLLSRFRSGTNNRTLEIRTSGGRLLQRRPLNLAQVGPSNTLLVTAADSVRRINYPAPRNVSLNPLIQASMPSRNLPTHWAAYDAVDILSFPAWPDGQIGSQEASALLQWVSMGGTLVFLGGVNSAGYAAGAASPLLPVTVEGSSPFRFDGSAGALVPGIAQNEGGGFLVSNISEIKPGAEAVLEFPTSNGESVPILVRRQHGLGQIIFCGLDFETPPVDLRNAVTPYWLALMPLPNIAAWEHRFHEHLAENAPPPTRRAARAPNLLLIMMICILYVAVVGPVNFYLLGKSNRIQWAWLTVPVIVLFFSGLIYTIGTISKGAQTVARETTILWGREGDPNFAERSIINVFTHRAANLYVEGRNEHLTVSDAETWIRGDELIYTTGGFTLAPPAPGGFGFGGANPRIAHVGNTPQVRSWRLRTYDIASFELRGPTNSHGTLDSTLRYHSGSNSWHLAGEIENRTGLNFYSSALFFGRGGLMLGELADGESLALDESKTVRVHMALSGDWMSINDAISRLVHSEEETENDSARHFNLESARETLTGILNPRGTGRLFPPQQGKLLFVGLAEEPAMTVSTNLNRDEESRGLLVIVELNPLPAGDRFNLAGDLMHVSLQDYTRQRGLVGIGSGDGRGAAASIPHLNMRDAFVVLALRLPFDDRGVLPQNLRNEVQRAQTNTNQDFTVGAYDLRGGQLVTIPEGAFIPTGGGSILSPTTGTGWVVLSASERDEDQQTGGQPGLFRGWEDIRVTRTEFPLNGVHVRP